MLNTPAAFAPKVAWPEIAAGEKRGADHAVMASITAPGRTHGVILLGSLCQPLLRTELDRVQTLV
jgi:hypothetical protein